MSTADNANGVDDARKIAEAGEEKADPELLLSERSIPYLASDDDANGERREDDGKQDVAEVGPDFVIVVMVMVVVMMVHACAGKFVVRPGDVFVTRRPMWLACVYAKCGHMVAMTKAFDEMPHRGVPSWNALIVGLRKERKVSSRLKGCFMELRRRDRKCR
ncbi:hypothetical protein OsJ_01353 [Oryza sativa Japonica Group]|uniref:Pentatricopeptide repeat-containing protein n=1 Tax=Oryza sativa subsp. japonica TaxID=39947 RepID=B9EVK6_ORYSJ|nr:hypothetical protein OsJ_01353 [Oryza sativa Japonica Group]